MLKQMGGWLGLSQATGDAARNRRFLLRFCAALAGLILLFTLLFRLIMLHEGQRHSWLAGLYWTLTTMSTLGFGDITFESDLGRLFSTLVLLSGMVLLLTMLPFVFIQFFYQPWLERQNRARAPRTVPAALAGHVILTHFDDVAANLIDKLRQYGAGHVIVTPELSRALELHDLGYRVLFGELDDPETYRRAGAERAAMVLVLNGDVAGTNIVFTIREAAPAARIVAAADLDDSVDILKLAGANDVFQFSRLLGKSLARRVLGVSMSANIIGEFGRLRIAEAPAMRTWMQGKTIAQAKLREMVGVNIVGLWQEGKFALPAPDTVIGESTVLILAGSLEQLSRFDETILGAAGEGQKSQTVLILGGGRIGQAVCENLRIRGIDYRVVEKEPKPGALRDRRVIPGSAADLDTLKRAGVEDTPAIIVTTHDDDLNIYLTIYCRRLRPDAQIISRASYDRNINTLHRAGANLVMSYSSLVSATVTNLLRPEQMLMLSEGLNIFRVALNTKLAGKRLTELRLRQDIGCNVVAVKRGENIDINPDPTVPLVLGDELYLIGLADAERRFAELYPAPPSENVPAKDDADAESDGPLEFGEEGEVAEHGTGMKR